MSKINYAVLKREPADCYLRERCRGPKYHVCLKGKEDTFPDLLGTRKPQAGGGRPLQDGNLARWARHREANQARDTKIIEAYRDRNLSMNQIVEQLKVNKDAVIKVLHEAQAAGLVQIRKQHVNYS